MHMSTAIETKRGTSSDSSDETYVVLGVLLEFLSTPEQINDQISVMRGTVPPGVVVPLHCHPDPEIFYVLDGAVEAFQAEGASRGWKTVKAGEVLRIPGNVNHALRNTASIPMSSLAVTKTELYRFFRELAQPLDKDKPAAPPTSEEMQRLFAAANRYGYRLASPEENAAIGILLQ
jgi:quercetin dioxygenase-like cupin family protein